MRERLIKDVNFEEIAKYQEKAIFLLKPEVLRKQMEQFILLIIYYFFEL